MSYTRVIPRDLFNEASLLKCYGHLYIALENANGAARFSEEDVPYFDIRQREDDGAIYIGDLELLANGQRYRLTRPLNSRCPWPLYAERVDDNDFEPVSVFNDDGALTVDMLALIAPR